MAATTAMDVARRAPHSVRISVSGRRFATLAMRSELTMFRAFTRGGRGRHDNRGRRGRRRSPTPRLPARTTALPNDCCAGDAASRKNPMPASCSPVRRRASRPAMPRQNGATPSKLSDLVPKPSTRSAEPSDHSSGCRVWSSLNWAGQDVWYAQRRAVNDEEIRLSREQGRRRLPLPVVEHAARVRDRAGEEISTMPACGPSARVQQLRQQRRIDSPDRGARGDAAGAAQARPAPPERTQIAGRPIGKELPPCGASEGTGGAFACHRTDGGADARRPATSSWAPSPSQAR